MPASDAIQEIHEKQQTNDTNATHATSRIIYFAGTSIALLRISGAASGEIMNASSARAASGCFATARPDLPTF
mgnify:CR=1 FL=1